MVCHRAADTSKIKTTRDGFLGVSQKRMVRIGETLGKRMEHVQRHIILYYARMRCVQENGRNSEYQHMVLEHRAGKVGPKR